jgi:glutamyl-tRNA synthetase
MPPVVTRFAPSPTGRLHVGNIRVAVHNWLFARKEGGRFLLRLDDTDRERSRAEYADAILADLGWLGLEPDAVFRQSERLALYDQAFERLRATGRVYPCYESAHELDVKRKVQLARGQPPVYDRAALRLSDEERRRLEAEGVAPHWRFLLRTEAPVAWTDLVRGQTHVDPSSLSDPVVRRADGSYLYMLPSVVDDIDMRVSHVVRGEDHVTNSGVQIQMFEALGAAAPCFAHEPLLAGSDGPLSKRLGSAGADALREQGIEPLALVALLARLGTSLPVEPVTDRQALIAAFDFESVARGAPRFDEQELAQLNSRIVHQLEFSAVRDRLPEAMDARAWEAVRSNIATVKEAMHWWRVIAGPLEPPRMSDDDRRYLSQAGDVLASLDWDGSDRIWAQWTGALKAATGRKGASLFLPLRLALTGERHGPEMARLLPLIGRQAALDRLERAAARL